MNISPIGVNIDEALEALASCTVWYPDYLEAMRIITKSFSTTRNRKDPSSALLIGPTGVGKTRLCRMLEKQLGTTTTPLGPTCMKKVRPCIYIELPEASTTRSLSMVVAIALGATPLDKQSITSLEMLIIERLITMEVQLVILDDFHHIAEKGRVISKSSLCNWLMKLLNNSGIPFLVSGSLKAENLINGVQELSDRFPYRAHLKVLPLAEEYSDSTLLGVLAGLQQEMIRLGKLTQYPHLTDPHHYKAMYMATQGNFRRLSNLLHDTFSIALTRGDYTLSMDDFSLAADDLAFCCNPNYFRMPLRQLNNAIKTKIDSSLGSGK